DRITAVLQRPSARIVDKALERHAHSRDVTDEKEARDDEYSEQRREHRGFARERHVALLDGVARLLLCCLLGFTFLVGFVAHSDRPQAACSPPAIVPRSCTSPRAAA